MSAPALSVVIATHKRADILRQCIEHLEKQTIANQLEVIVISDGEDPETTTLCTHSQFSIFNFQFFSIPKSQQGVARNRGAEKATAPIILFINDDIFLAPDSCEKHVHAHSKCEARDAEPAAVLGFTTWDPSLDITPVMRWLETSGWQFGYPMLQPYRHAFIPSGMQHRFTYASNISLPTEIARAHPFREDVSLYGWEDTLWGLELARAGIGLYYEPDAAALHHHRITTDDSLRRMETLGRSIVAITHIAPELDRRPAGWKLAAYRLIALLPTMRGRHARAFLRGISDAESLA